MFFNKSPVIRFMNILSKASGFQVLTFSVKGIEVGSWQCPWSGPEARLDKTARFFGYISTVLLSLSLLTLQKNFLWFWGLWGVEFGELRMEVLGVFRAKN